MNTEETYNGKPVLKLNAETKWPFSFGVGKAKAILNNIDAIRAFVQKHDKAQAQAPKQQGGF